MGKNFDAASRDKYMLSHSDDLGTYAHVIDTNENRKVRKIVSEVIYHVLQILGDKKY